MQQPDYGAKFIGKGGEFSNYMNFFFRIIFFISSLTSNFPLCQKVFVIPEVVHILGFCCRHAIGCRVAWSSASAFGPIRARTFLPIANDRKAGFWTNQEQEREIWRWRRILFGNLHSPFWMWSLCLLHFLWSSSPIRCFLTKILIQEAGKHRYITVFCTQGKFSAYGWQKRAH